MVSKDLTTSPKLRVFADGCLSKLHFTVQQFHLNKKCQYYAEYFLTILLHSFICLYMLLSFPWIIGWSTAHLMLLYNETGSMPGTQRHHNGQRAQFLKGLNSSLKISGSRFYYSKSSSWHFKYVTHIYVFLSRNACGQAIWINGDSGSAMYI